MSGRNRMFVGGVILRPSPALHLWAGLNTKHTTGKDATLTLGFLALVFRPQLAPTLDVNIIFQAHSSIGVQVTYDLLHPHIRLLLSIGSDDEADAAVVVYVVP